DATRPLFLVVHYIDPHGPYDAPPPWFGTFDHEGRSDVPPQRIPAYQRRPGITDGLFYVDRYDEEVAYADAEIGRLLDGYARLHPMDRTLVVVTADHGE